MGEGVLRGALAGNSGPGKSRSGTLCVHFVMHALRRAAEWRVWRHGGQVAEMWGPAQTPRIPTIGLDVGGPSAQLGNPRLPPALVAIQPWRRL